MISSIRWTAAAPALVCALVLGLAACGDGGGTTEPLPCVPLALDVSPRDTAVYVDGSYTLDVQTFASCGPEVTYEVENAIATVDPATTRLSGKSYGRGRVIVRSGVLADTVMVSVVPRGKLAVSYLPGGGVELVGIFVVNTDLSGRRRLTDARNAGGTSWTRSGEAVLYQSYSSNTAWWNIFRVDTLGSRRRLTDAPPEIAEAWPVEPGDGWIYYSVRRDAGASESLVRIPLAGGTPQVIRSDAVPRENEASRPSPSPDGRRVAFQGSANGGHAIRFLDLQTGTDLPARLPGEGPQYSPAGNRLAFVRDQVVYVADADGSNERRISPEGSHYHGWVTWSPGGGWLATYAFVPQARVELIQVQTGLVVPLPRTDGLLHPAWHPAFRD
jgi:hypothetical protein